MDLDAALRAIDDANAADPTSWNGEPLARAQGRRAHAWVLRLDPSAAPALQLAARAHHLRRWTMPRSSYPEGRAGYLRWRRDQAVREAAELAELLGAAGVAAAVAERAGAILRKVGLATDLEVQTYEDAVSLTFLETQLTSTADRLDADHLVAVIAKTLAKMSDAGRSAAAGIPLDSRDAALVARAVEQFSSGGR